MANTINYPYVIEINSTLQEKNPVYNFIQDWSSNDILKLTVGSQSNMFYTKTNGGEYVLNGGTTLMNIINEQTNGIVVINKKCTINYTHKTYNNNNEEILTTRTIIIQNVDNNNNTVQEIIEKIADTFYTTSYEESNTEINYDTDSSSITCTLSYNNQDIFTTNFETYFKSLNPTGNVDLVLPININFTDLDGSVVPTVPYNAVLLADSENITPGYSNVSMRLLLTIPIICKTAEFLARVAEAAAAALAALAAADALAAALAAAAAALAGRTAIAAGNAAITDTSDSAKDYAVLTAADHAAAVAAYATSVCTLIDAFKDNIVSSVINIPVVIINNLLDEKANIARSSLPTQLYNYEINLDFTLYLTARDDTSAAAAAAAAAKKAAKAFVVAAFLPTINTYRDACINAAVALVIAYVFYAAAASAEAPDQAN